MLHDIAPLLIYNLANDDFGNLVIVYAGSWASALYFARGY